MAVTENTTTVGTVTTTKRTGTDTAQVSPAGSTGDAIHVAGTVDVNETVVSTDVVILDPDGADAVQVDGEGGEKNMDLPLNDAGNGVATFT